MSECQESTESANMQTVTQPHAASTRSHNNQLPVTAYCKTCEARCCSLFAFLMNARPKAVRWGVQELRKERHWSIRTGTLMRSTFESCRCVTRVKAFQSPQAPKAEHVMFSTSTSILLPQLLLSWPREGPSATLEQVLTRSYQTLQLTSSHSS